MRAPSLRRQLLTGVLAPLVIVSGIEAVALGHLVEAEVGDVYDRFLVATVYSVADSLTVEAGTSVHTQLPLTVREAFESASGGAVYFSVSTLDGRKLAGDRLLPAPELGSAPSVRPHLQDLSIEGRPVRMATVRQPVEMANGLHPLVVQVAHTLEARDRAKEQAFHDAVWRQMGGLAAIALLASAVIVRRLRPVQRLQRDVQARDVDDLSALMPAGLKELEPVVDALNLLMRSLAQLHAREERFVADASHQLQTPLTVLKTQLQSALSESEGPTREALLRDMLRTTDRASGLARQMLSMARVHRARTEGQCEPVDWDVLVKDAAVDLSPLIAQRQLLFELRLHACRVAGDRWLLGEVVRNLLHNAVRFTPIGGALGMNLDRIGNEARLTVWDTGPGFPEEALPRVGEPFFAVPGVPSGAGLGLAICTDAATALGGRLLMRNRIDPQGQVTGAAAEFWLPHTSA